MDLGRNYKIESDELNVTLYKKMLNKKSGLEYWRPQSYYSSVHNALDGLIEQEVMKTGLKDLKMVVQKIDELKALIPLKEEGIRVSQ